jgi:replicative DNA helicase
LILIAARTSQGKTALALNIARVAAASTCVLFFSLEMSKHQLFTRLLSSESQIDHHAIRVGSTKDADWHKIGNAIQAISDLNLYIDDSAHIGIREVRARSRQLRRDHGLGLIIVDYIQMMKARGKFDMRSEEVGSFSRGLKAIAKELEVPVVALAQLSRAGEAGYGRKARKPELSDLRESGSLEQDSDVVMMIYKPEGKDGDADPPVELHIRKQRNGPTGMVRLYWDPECVRFSSWKMS